jgi:retinol dehydrogenase-12
MTRADHLLGSRPMSDRDLENRVFFVTGANTGIGKVTALELARRGGHVILACRSAERTEPVVKEIRDATKNDNVEFLELDLGSFASVRKASETFLARDLPLHVLINNAGVAGIKGLTSDGFEVHFGTNHLGHFLLTSLLMPRLRTSTPARIVTVASRGHYRDKVFDMETVREESATAHGFGDYCRSKLANVLFSAELARRLKGTGITTYSLHPGGVASDIWRHVFWPMRSLIKLFLITNEEGALTTLHCATDREAGKETGLYYDESRELWTRSVEWTHAPPIE